MRRDDLELLLREAHRLTHADEILVIGSQSVRATWSQNELPATATLSLEADMFVRRRGGEMLRESEAERLTRLLEQSGILSDFDVEHGVYIDPVSLNTADLPDGWEDRLVPLPVRTDDGQTVTGVCLDPYDACVEKPSRSDQRIELSSPLSSRRV